jgi:acylphosphatase
LASLLYCAVLAGRRFVIRGRVQRVGFRLFVEDVARREGLRGYVRNQHDGSVETIAEGDVEALHRFELAVRRGPPGARVDEVESSDALPSGRFAGFSVTG